MRNKALFSAALAVLLLTLPLAIASPRKSLRLKYIVIVSRHGVRAPTWDEERLDQYSTAPWPKWGVSPGDLTLHGRALIKQMGSYYRDWLSSEHLLGGQGCQDAKRIYIWADTDERTIETGRAFAESLLPGCGLATHSNPQGEKDSVFSGVGEPDPELSLKAVRGRLAADSQKLVAQLRPAFDTLQFVLDGNQTGAKDPPPPQEISASLHGRSVELNGPLDVGSTLSEDLLLEYTDGMRDANLGWGRLTQENLLRILEIHTVHSDLTRRTFYLACAKGSNLLAHVLRSIEQAASGKALPGALGRPGDSLLILAGHDANLLSISGILGLNWQLGGYGLDETPPGGALVFSLWRSDSGQYFVKTQFVVQTLEQMHDDLPVSLPSPPAKQDISIPGCGPSNQATSCPWPLFKTTVQRAINPAFVSFGKN